MGYLERKNPGLEVTIADSATDSDILDMDNFGGGMGLGFDSAFDGTVISYKVPINKTDYTDAANFKVFHDLNDTLISQTVAASQGTYADPRVMVFPAIIIVATTSQTGATVITCFPLS